MKNTLQTPLCMNYLKSIPCLLLLWLLAFSAKAQESNNYYRFFSVTVKNLTRAEFDQFTALRNKDETYLIDSFCSTNSSVLIKVDATANPKRIEDIKTELQDIFQNRFASNRVQSVKTISYKDQFNFCK